MDLKRKLQLPSTLPLSTGSIPAFLLKLRNLLDDSENEDLICWDENGTSFHLYDQTRFAKEILPQYFKHNNLASFIRQLNMYGFKKISTIEHGGLHSKDDMEFENQYFVREQPDLMEYIKRKGSSSIRDKLGEYGVLQPAQVNDVLVDVKDLKQNQEQMNQRLELIKRENGVLWREVTSLRRKHQQQQHIINKLIQFMMTMARGTRNMKRTLPMIEIGPSAKKKPEPPVYQTATYSNTTDQQTEPNVLSSSAHSAGSTAENGITIRDITDDDITENFYEPIDILRETVESSDIPCTVAVENEGDSNEQLIAAADNSVVSRSPTPPNNPMLFKTQFSENVNEVQSDIDLLKDLFSSSDSLGLPQDTFDSIFDGNNSDFKFSLPLSSSGNDLAQGAGAEANPYSVDLSTPTLDLDSLMSGMGGMSSAPEIEGGVIANADEFEHFISPLDSDDETDSNRPVISSLDLD